MTAHTHPDAAALHRAVLAAPDDDTPRLAYADWLGEHGDSDRAEFIRVQCRLARTREWEDGSIEDTLRADRLLREYESAWMKLPDGAQVYEYGHQPFVRGFLGKARVSSHLSADVSRRHFAGFPIAEAEYACRGHTGTEVRFDQLFAFDAFPSLRTVVLDLEHGHSNASRAAVCQAVATAERLSAITRLEVCGNPTLAGLEALVTSPNLRRLEALSVRGDGVGDAHARLLAERAHLPALRELVLGHRSLTPAGGRMLGNAAWLGQLETLRLYGHERFGDAGLTGMLKSRLLPRLQTVQLHYCGQNGGETATLSGANLPGLVEVIVTGGNAPGKSVPALTAGRQQFRSLNLESGGMTAEQAGRFFGGPGARGLRVLKLMGPSLDSATVAALLASPLPGALRKLHLPCQSGVNPGPLLLDGPAWPHLARLSVPNGMDAESLLKLIESPKFARLVSLATWCHDGGPAFLKRLAKSPAVARFRELDLNLALTLASARELADSPHLDGIDRLAVSKGRTDRVTCERLVERFGKRIVIRGFNA